LRPTERTGTAQRVSVSVSRNYDRHLAEPIRRRPHFSSGVGRTANVAAPRIVGAGCEDRSVALDPIDLRHRGAERVIGCYVVDTEDGPALFDCGPSTCVDALKDGLSERGLALTDVRHLLLSHIHLDHAGAAGVLVREHPGLQVHVSEIGAPHLVEPSRLEASARRLYGDLFNTLWGELAPVPEANIHVVGDRVLGLECFPSPGHASHHVVYLGDDGTAYCGDAAGVRIQPHRLVLPPTPPPELDPDGWHRTIRELERREPQHLALIHFGVAEDVRVHLAALRSRLDYWVELVGKGASQDDFIAEAKHELHKEHRDVLDEYDRAMPLWQSYAGLKRYWERRDG
jgi:glyoxylase-like metal-dependent hydrolase (beta-lactamase superfamily II)